MQVRPGPEVLFDIASGYGKDVLQKLFDEIKFPTTVRHLPPGTSKWNKIEHRLFSFITITWQGKPLRSYRPIVQLIVANNRYPP
jgi:hypothetical protein